MASVSVVVPWRADSGHRDAAWQYLRPRWEATGEVVEGTRPDGPWVKALAVRDALTRASGDLLVIADADVYCDPRPALAAVDAGSAWAVPHLQVHRLTPEATAAVLAGGPLGGAVEQRPYRGMIGGGVVVLPRVMYEACPLDTRFAGWGQEDQAWGIALTALHGPPWRGTADLWHLWHPPQERISRSTGSMVGRYLLDQYVAAADEGRMREYLDRLRAEATREKTMFVYRNKHDPSSVHEFPTRNARLDSLGNWELIEEPDSQHASAAPAPEVEQPPVLGPDTDLYHPPAAGASRAEWLAYARWRQVPGPIDRMSAEQLAAACG